MRIPAQELSREAPARQDHQTEHPGDGAKLVVERPAKWAKAAGVRSNSIIVPPGGMIFEKIMAIARKQKCDLIFMSTNGRRGPSQFLGSEAAKVVTHSKTPVLIVR